MPPIVRNVLFSTCLAWAAVPVLAQPAPAASSAGASFFGEIVSIVVPLAVIILVLLLVLRLARRRYGVGPRDAPLTIAQVLPVGPRERIVLLRTRTGRLFAVGVGGASVRFLADLDPADWVEPPAPAPGRAKVFGWPLTRRDPGPAAASATD
jgi:flagellar biogenesis protein FliO